MLLLKHIVLFLIFFSSLMATCQSVTNGSINGGATGNSAFGTVTGWSMCSVVSGWNNTPDLCDVNFPSYVGNQTVTPVPSPDGGTWVGLANGVNPIEDECIVGNITGISTGNSYFLEFYGACFGTGVGSYANGSPVSLTVTIGADIYTVIIPMVGSVWNTYTLPYTATGSNMSFQVHNTAGGGYASLDGFKTYSSLLGIDTTMCVGSSIILDATTPNSTYLWNDNSTNPTLTVTQAGTYWVNVTNSFGTVSDTINITYSTASTVDLGNDTILCLGATVNLDATSPDATYLWQDNSTNPTLNVATAGLYWVAVSGSCGNFSDSINVSYYPAQWLNIGNDTIICEGSSLNLNATSPNSTYLWQDNSTNPTFTVTQAGTYWVEVTGSCGNASDTISIESMYCEPVVDTIILTMPNTFTPTNDGVNDNFVPIEMEGLTSPKLTILNRWGNILFETSNLQAGWDGKSDNIDCLEGTYFWMVKYLDKSNNEITQTGFVTLHR